MVYLSTGKKLAIGGAYIWSASSRMQGVYHDEVPIEAGVLDRT